MADAPRFLLLGNPENRRVTLFQEALAQAGLPAAQVVSWLELLDDPDALLLVADEPLLFRVDSPGENEAVERAFLKRGYEAARELGCSTIAPARLDALPSSRGRIVCPRQAHLGFESALDDLARALAQRPRWLVLNPVEEIRELFDKRVTSPRYAALGVPVPETLTGITTSQELRAAMDERGWESAFVKLSSGSSASCLAVFHRRPTATDSLHTTIEMARDGWFNTLKVRHVQSAQGVEVILRFLLREGSQIERAMPKARLADAFFDCRVLCVGGEPAFTVVRQNSHPITNLHLGGWRGEVAALEAASPPDVLAAGYDSCRRIAGAYRALHVGVDLMFEASWAGHRVIEANAFGDLLPNLLRDGLSVYGWEIRAALARARASR